MGAEGRGTCMTSSLDSGLLNTAVLRWLDTLAQQGIFTTDRDLVIRSWNRWLEEHTGHLATAVVGRPLFEAFPDLEERGFGGDYHGGRDGPMEVVGPRLQRFLV